MGERSVAPASFRPLLVRALILPLILVLACAAVLLWQVTRLVSASAWVDHTDQVIARADELSGLHADMQSGVRGYLITMDPDFRSPYDRALQRVDAAFDSLAQMITDNPLQQRRLSDI